MREDGGILVLPGCPADIAVNIGLDAALIGPLHPEGVVVLKPIAHCSGLSASLILQVDLIAAYSSAPLTPICCELRIRSAVEIIIVYSPAAAVKEEPVCVAPRDRHRVYPDELPVAVESGIVEVVVPAIGGIGVPAVVGVARCEYRCT